MYIVSFITVLVSMLVPSFQASMAADSILLSNSSTRIVSKGGSFVLGFFSPGNSGKHYLGIWYINIPIQAVVWVANRVNPVNDSSATATLTLNSTGNLVLVQNDVVIWYSTSLKQVQNPVAELLDSGNLVVREEKDDNPEEYLWQSFDHPTDTLLSGMKLGWDLKTGLNRNLISWKTQEDPSPGDFSVTIEPRNYPEMYVMKGGSKFFRNGPWNGVKFSGSPELRKNNHIFDFGFISTRYEIYYYWRRPKNSSVLSRFVINQTDEARIRYVWSKGEWDVYTKKPSATVIDISYVDPMGNVTLLNNHLANVWKGSCLSHYRNGTQWIGPMDVSAKSL